MDLTNEDLQRLRQMMDNFIPINGAQHPEQRLDRIESRLDQLSESVHQLNVGLSNAQLIQKGVLWLGGVLGGSACVMAMTFLFGGSQ